MTQERFPTTVAGCLQGARLTLPLWPGILVFASAFGAAAGQKGLSLGEAAAMSAFVYAGASQMVGLGLWSETFTPSTLLGLMTVTGMVNARLILMGAAIQPWIAGQSLARKALLLFLLTDANWLIGTRYRAEGGQDIGIFLGAGIALWIVWVGGTIPGYLAGTLVPEPRQIGLDLVMPIFFITMLVPLWKGFRPALPWFVAGAVALLVQWLVPGYAFIVVGALAGMLTGAFLPEPPAAATPPEPSR